MPSAATLNFVGQELILRGEADAASPRTWGGLAVVLWSQRRPHAAFEGLHAITDHGIGFDLEQQVRAALQVEAQIDLLDGQPCRQAFEAAAGEEVRRRIYDDDKADREDRRAPPLREIENGSPRDQTGRATVRERVRQHVENSEEA